MPYGAKTPPPKGTTGADGVDPSYPDCQTWADDETRRNIALRMPDEVIALDFDNYGGKPGAATRDEWERRHGPLPPTWRSTSRADDVSGLYFYRVPKARTWLTNPGGGFEIVQRAHRYAVVWPSIHPEGAGYRWFTPTGDLAPSGMVPTVDVLPALPAAWVGALESDASRTKGVNLTAEERAQVVAGFPAGEPCAHVIAARARMVLDDLGAGSRHDLMTAATMAVVGAGRRGCPGARETLTAMRAQYLAAVTSDGSRTQVEAEREWDRAVVGALRIAAADHPQPGEGCPDEWLAGKSGNRGAAVDFAAASDDWGPPPPAHVTPDAPPTPRLDGLPPVVRDMVEAVSAQADVDPALPLAAALGALSSATLGVWDIGDPHADPWCPGPSVVWVNALADSGERKGAASKPLLAPLYTAGDEFAAELKAENRKRAQARKATEAKLKALDAGKIPPGMGRDLSPEQLDAMSESLARDLDALAPLPVLGMKMADPTPEALGQRMAAQYGPGAVVSTEVTPWHTIGGGYGHGRGNYGFTNAAFSGESWEVVRTGRETDTIYRPVLQWLTFAQPDALAGYATGANMAAAGTGFLGRHIFYLPASRAGSRFTSGPVVPRTVADAWADAIRRILTAAQARWRRTIPDTPDGIPKRAPVLRLTPDALAALEALRVRVEPMLPTVDDAHRQWLTRHHERLARLAAVLALLDDPDTATVGDEPTRQALTLGDDMIAHGLPALDILTRAGKSPEVGDKVLEAIAKVWAADVAAGATGAPRVTVSAVYRKVANQTSWVTGADDVAAVMRDLVDRGYLAGPFRLTSTGGGRPTETYAVHPGWFAAVTL